jgi:hypothetical protein
MWAFVFGLSVLVVAGTILAVHWLDHKKQMREIEVRYGK